ncbi:hypothetical protein EPD60_06545 [Flaviaesturariibacter flavus]|uniref:Uncharacterized protein n=1 Tax=Flaviaesturariibacter flavus TaxID=2502780 RepID=A0A4R1BKT4_9BACT|nr:hypothetical protein [Flaviaesturariibacter flavus]TCJ17838.1 hypothetical protein EPD60_06545 [Flaviaesturariibacter flavus]
MMKYFACCYILLFSHSSFAQTHTVKQLYDEYRGNRSMFQNKYRNQTVTVTGKVRSISPASSFWKEQDVHRVYLTATGYENFVVCQVPYKDSALLSAFKAGDIVTVTGTSSSNISDAVFLSNCSFASSKAVTKKSTAPENAPLGKYNVYQDNGQGFNFQYTFYLKSYTTYLLNGKAGNCTYDPASKAIRFATGPLKGFAGLYRKTTDNPADPPSFLLNANGTVPVLNSGHHGYQFGYYQEK